MPQIRTYTAPLVSDESARINAQTGEDIAAGARSVGNSYREAGATIGQGISDIGRAVQKRNEQSDSISLITNFAQLHSDLTNEWEDAKKNADPSDPDLAKNFMDNVVQPRLDALGDKVQTSAGQELHARLAAGVTDDFSGRTIADQATLAGDALVNGFKSVQSNLVNSVYLDPTSLPAAREQMNAGLDALAKSTHSSLPKPAMDKLRQDTVAEMTKSALLGKIDRNPTAGLADVTSGRYDKDLAPGAVEALRTHAYDMQKAAEADARQAAAAAREEERVKTNTATSQVYASVIQPDGSLQVPADYFKNITKLSRLPQQDPGRIEAMINFGHAVMKEGTATVTDPHTFSDFVQRFGLPDTDPRVPTPEQITQAHIDGHLSEPDTSALLARANAHDPARTEHDRQFNQLMAGYKLYITKSDLLGLSPIFDAPGDQRWYEFQRDARTIFDADTAAKVDPQATEKKILGMVPRYQPTRGSATTNIGAAMKNPLPPVGAVAPRKAGESATDYLKRSH